MKKLNILVIIGDCLAVNSSANLCHLAYINGLVNQGHNVELLTVGDAGAQTDNSLVIPESVILHTYGISLYEKLSHLKKRHTDNAAPIAEYSADTADVGKQSALSKAKTKLRELYGVYGPDKAWHNKAKHFKSDTEYDFVLSVSCPFISHLTAYTLIKNKNIKYKKWIQIWEDPWFSDIAYASDTEECKSEEGFLCSVAEDIVYVSPVTLQYQRKLFPEYADKMRFVPLPSYYISDGAETDFSKYTYGYFGDFAPDVRNLKPFYTAAVNLNLTVNICGNPAGYLPSENNISVYPRVPVSVLKEYEDKTNVLVFLCNLKGGQIPGKIYQYSASNKIILFILDGTEEEKKAIKTYFSKFNRYVFCENNEASITSAVRSIERGDFNDTAKCIDSFFQEKIIEEIIR